MGAVYTAEHRLMERLVALKLISPTLLDNAASVDRFRREFRAAARLSHPNVVTAFDADQVIRIRAASESAAGAGSGDAQGTSRQGRPSVDRLVLCHKCEGQSSKARSLSSGVAISARGFRRIENSAPEMPLIRRDSGTRFGPG
jgi:serine/threonine protein kinase